MNRLVVLHQGAIGDFLLALAVIQSVRAAAEADHVLAIASAPSARLAAGRSAIGAWLSPEHAGLHTLFRDGPPGDSLRDILDSADIVLSFLSAASEPIHERLCRSGTSRIISLDPRPDEQTLSRRLHIAEQWTASIRNQGLPIPDPSPAIIRLPIGKQVSRSPSFPPTAWNPGACANTASAERNPYPRILIHPGSGGRSKCWPAARFAALAQALSHANIHWMLGPAELESEPERFAPIRERISNQQEPLLVEEDLLRVAEHMAGMDLYIGNDAGTTHLAAALGLPTLAIFGPTDPRIWRPLGDHVLTVCPPEPAAITVITLEEVAEALSRHLGLC